MKGESFASNIVSSQQACWSGGTGQIRLGFHRSNLGSERGEAWVHISKTLGRSHSGVLAECRTHPRTETSSMSSEPGQRSGTGGAANKQLISQSRSCCGREPERTLRCWTCLPPGQRHAAEVHMGRGWASVLKTTLSRLSRLGSSEKSRYRYLSVSPRKKLSILSRGLGYFGSRTLLMEV